VAPRDRAGWLAGAALAAVLALLGWVRHRNGWSGGLDLGIFDQGVWLLSEGRAPEVTLNARNLFADHLSPVLLLFVPLYVVAATPAWLLVGQAASLGAGLPAIRRFARNRGVDPTAVTVAYVASAPLWAAAVFDFHPATVAVAPVAWLLVALDGDRRVPVAAWALAVAVCRADLGWVVAACAVVAPARHRRLLVLLGLGAMAVGAVVPPLLDAPSTFETHYGHIGESVRDVATHPWRVLLDGFAGQDLLTVALWCLAGGLLVVWAPRWSLALVAAGLPVLLSRWPGTEEPFFHYGAPLAPIALAGTVVALSRPDRPELASPRLVLAGAVVAAAVAGPLSPRAPEEYRVASVLGENLDGRLDDALDAVPPGAPVAAVNFVLPHLTHRDLAYGWPIPFQTTAFADLYGGADPDAAARIDVVVVEPEDREQAERLGFELEDLGSLLIGRR
jgi:hypothetical protein